MRVYLRSFLFISILICCNAINVHAQIDKKISGTVLAEKDNQPMTGASIYFNGTTIGTFIDEKGEFELPYDPLLSEIVISYLGYKTLTYKIQPGEWSKRFKFLLEEEAEELRAVNITAKRGTGWQQNLDRFLFQFLGNSKLARSTKILNPEVLFFEYDRPSKTLKASSSVPLILENKGLGYTIDYDLAYFEYQGSTGRMSLLGYTKFTPMKGSKSKIKKWKRNRVVSYKGSFTHFVHALQNKSLKKYGYEIRKVKLVPNPDRPSDEQILAARKQLKKQANNPENNRPIPLSDSTKIIINRSRLAKNILVVEAENYNPVNDISMTNETMAIQFDGLWQIQYTGEKANRMKESGAPFTDKTQTSTISLLSSEAVFDQYGLLVDPLSVLFKGYWVYEKTPYLLPLDFIGAKSKE